MTRRVRSRKRLQAGWESAFLPKRIKLREEEETEEGNEESSIFENRENEEMMRNGEPTKWIVWDSQEDFEDTTIDEDESRDEINLENMENGISFEDVVSHVAAVFLQNNVSRNFGQDIFQCVKLLSRERDVKFSHVKKRMESWGNFSTRIYSFCAQCSSILSCSKTCVNNQCLRYGKSQANVASLKTVITYSIRQQVEEMFKNDVFDSSILTRSSRIPSINERLCDTPKYKERVRRSEQEHPNLLTLFLSLSTDGFRKRGCARGEIWPLFLAAHDVTKGSGTFREYRPQFVILAGIIQSNTKLRSPDFKSFFERMKLEMEETNEKPLRVKLEENWYSVRLEIFQSMLDMDVSLLFCYCHNDLYVVQASKKIRGLPNWLSYGCCSICDIQGKPTKTKHGQTICWYSEEAVRLYHDDYHPKKLIQTCLPPPWADGFDGLHLIFEGTSRDLLKDLLGNGSWTGFRIPKKVRLAWAKALDTAIIPTGRASYSLIDPVQLSTRTGTEVQQVVMNSKAFSNE
ncbi:hypothetical protein B9Z55_015920 [Caenorhabditis nigoni]|uniref:Uncharacterized protein n=1 Tax=Caenorhabditis nigoni TaxID=1611254 RepID=A0A2G5UCD1_9PELO|nr:hypothetical protein B9Z55_015920 [Caenorhabditis nigoni]